MTNEDGLTWIDLETNPAVDSPPFGWTVAIGRCSFGEFRVSLNASVTPPEYSIATNCSIALSRPLNDEQTLDAAKLACEYAYSAAHSG